VRLIALPAGSPFAIKQQWWRDLASEVPENFTTSDGKNYFDQRGAFQGALLALTIDSRHIVWEARSPRVADLSGYYPTLGPFEEKLGWFLELLSVWLASSCPPLVRLAFSAKLLQITSTASETYDILSHYLPALKPLLDPNPNDFVLQINRRKPSSDSVPGLPINRVNTWSKLNRAVVSEPGKPFTWPEQGCYSALELDVNTAPERAEILPQEMLPRLFRELADLGQYIAKHGDNPNARDS
jgi:hypothetical protein